VKLSGDKGTNKTVCKTPTIKNDPNPRWAGDNKFTLHDVRAQVRWHGGMRAGAWVWLC
jgi:hypothetical protein